MQFTNGLCKRPLNGLNFINGLNIIWTPDYRRELQKRSLMISFSYRRSNTNLFLYIKWVKIIRSLFLNLNLISIEFKILHAFIVVVCIESDDEKRQLVYRHVKKIQYKLNCALRAVYFVPVRGSRKQHLSSGCAYQTNCQLRQFGMCAPLYMQFR